jgi:hypothetical protein
MMARFHAYLNKVFQFRNLAARLTDSRPFSSDIAPNSSLGPVKNNLVNRTLSS